MPSTHGPVNAAAGDGTEEGRRPTIVPSPAAASPEISPRPKRRTFSAAVKLRILEATDRAADTGGIAAILRRGGPSSPRPTRFGRPTAPRALPGRQNPRPGAQPLAGPPRPSPPGPRPPGKTP